MTEILQYMRDGRGANIRCTLVMLQEKIECTLETELSNNIIVFEWHNGREKGYRIQVDWGHQILVYNERNSDRIMVLCFTQNNFTDVNINNAKFPKEYKDNFRKVNMETEYPHEASEFIFSEILAYFVRKKSIISKYSAEQITSTVQNNVENKSK